MTRTIRHAAGCAVLVVSLSACDAGGSTHAPPLDHPSPPSGERCQEPDVAGASLVLFAAEGSCVPGNVMVLYRCSPAAWPVLRLTSETGPVEFLGGRLAVQTDVVPANVRFVGSGDGLEILVADPEQAATPSPPDSPRPSTASSPALSVRTDPLVYVRHDGVTERWLRVEGRRALHVPPAAWLIGDSILDGGMDAVEAALDDWALTLDAEVGRSSSAGIDIARDATLQADAVLVELGTNDPSISEFRSNLIETLDLLRGVPLVVWQTSKGPEEETTIPAVNAAIQEVAAGYPNVAIADWAAFAPDEALSDGIHPDPGFEDLESDLVAPLLNRWRDAVARRGATSCAREVIQAVS